MCNIKQKKIFCQVCIDTMYNQDVAEKKLNKEQLKAVRHGKGPLIIIAGAGTGKTTVITERIKWLINEGLTKPSEILALTFTDKAAREMEERVDRAMPYGYTQMWISTFHSFCDRILRDEAFHIGLDPGFILMTEAESLIFLRDHLFDLPLDYFRPRGNPTKFLEGLLQHFNRLRDEDISPNEYLAYAQRIKESKNQRIKEEINKTMELAKTFKKYQELKIKEGVMDFADLISNTLRLFTEKPNVARQYQKQFKYVLVDEFQDTNIAQNELAILFAGKKKNITVCADDDQCLPPGTKIALEEGTKNIEDVQEGDEVLTAVGKGHIGISKVNKVMKRKKRARLLTLRTQKGFEITVTDNHKIFCYIPKRVEKKEFYYVYLMYRKNLGWRLGTTNDLAVRLKLERSADKIVGLRAFKSESEARYFETILSLKYQIPTVCFMTRNGVVIQGKWLKKLYEKFDTEKSALKLASVLGIDLDCPHYLLDAVTRGSSKRVVINFYLCYRKYVSKENRYRKLLRQPLITHQVSLQTSNKEIVKKLKKNNIALKRVKGGIRARLDTTNVQKAWRFAQKLASITGGFIEPKFTLGKINHLNLPALVIPTGNVLPGHFIPIKKGLQIFYDEIVDIKEKVKEETVYDLEIDRTHNFIANGIVVHNSIYKWRGAAISNVLQFTERFPKAKIIALIRNYRSTKNILDSAYQLIQYNNPDRLEVKEKINKKLVSARGIQGEKIQFINADRVENEAEAVAKQIKNLKLKIKNYNWRDFAILVRANDYAHLFSQALARAGIPYQFLGPGRLLKQPEVKNLIAYLKVLYNFEDDVALFRVLTMEIFALSARDLAAIRNFARKYNLSLFEACEDVAQEETARPRPRIYQESKVKISKIVKMIKRHLKLIPKETVGQILYFFLQETGLLKDLTEYKTEAAERKALNISKFFDKLKTYETEHEDASIFPVVDWLNMKMTIGESPLAADVDWTEVDAVNILTVHSAKGLEFPIVFLVNLVNQRFPSVHRREQIPIPEELIKEILPLGDYHEQEERRLFYVGMTRARDRLYLTAANYYGEGKREKKISPFVYEAIGKLETKDQRPKTKKQLSFFDFKPSKEIAQPTISNQRLAINYLSYSQIDVFNTCPLQYKYRYLLRIPVPPSSAQSFGSSIHKTLKDFYQMVLMKKKPKEKDLIAFLEKNWSLLGYASKAHQKKMFHLAKKMLQAFYQKSYDHKAIPLALEKTFSFPLNNELKIKGIIDRVDQLKNGQIEIIDYKTGKAKTRKELEYDLQMTVYGLAASDKGIYNKKPKDILLSFHFLDTQKKVSTKRTTLQLKKARKELIKMAEEIIKSGFYPTPGKHCDFCEYKLLCEAWK